MLSSAQIQHFREFGYIVIDGVEPRLLEPLRKASDRVLKKARAGQWPSRKIDDDIWGVSNLLDPVLEEPVFGEYMATPQVVEVARDLLGERELRLSLTNMLCNPSKKDFDIAWHRDLGDPKIGGEEELKVLREAQYGVQWNAALYDESCLRIVPGSHIRNMTDAERDVMLNRPRDPMPGEMIVDLKAGQTVYYNALIIHRGVYPCGQRRETLHANLSSMREPKPLKFQYEQVKFMEAPDFKKTIPAALHPLHDNWLKFAQRFQAEAVR
ncbi:MAG TPA: phytanoyl-CoA dioxygenase family protein [Planctomycetota bacterium]|nr:phytanoyl-CoA dioxygenase family protein [Planctomycetota bacterium]